MGPSINGSVAVGLVALLVALSPGCARSPTIDDWLRQLKNEEVVLRRQACRELGDLPSQASQSVPALAEALRDENSYVRHDAAAALGKIGPAARPAVPSLLILLKDKEKSVTTTAAAALKKIDPGSAAKAGVR
ncbi:MAG TPA: HEAT repeat domain-containing protein [Gemmataceae bacterium]|nr:HEAT repeat domain-containing protein [Gemmataceae bacterium]